MNEAAFIAALRALATDPAARGLLDDAAVLPRPAGDLVLTTDILVEGVHFLPDDPPGDVAWKLVATNLSDLAAKGARPLGVLLGYALLGEPAWHEAFVEGLSTALHQLDTPLLGGDTVAPGHGPRTLSVTALGAASQAGTPSRAGAKPGDGVWITGTLGDAGAGLRILRGELGPEAYPVARYRRPEPRLAAGAGLAAHVSAMMDVSDGLLIDLSRLTAASGVGAAIDLSRVPLSPAFGRLLGTGPDARLFAATAGDDYELLFTMAGEPPVPATRIGDILAGKGLTLFDGPDPVPLPASLGWEHRA